MKTILVIEDNMDIRENATEILELANYKVSTASNGEEAFNVLQIERPDLIICDIHMPVMDGYHFLRRLMNEPDFCRIPFIFLTAFSEKAEVQKGLQLGAVDYIIKPFDDDLLLRVVADFLEP